MSSSGVNEKAIDNGSYLAGVQLSAYAALDGVTDDSAAFAAALALATARGQPLVGSPGKTMMIASTLAYNSVADFRANGLTIKKAAAFAGNAITCTLPVEFHDLTVDGNRSAGASGQGISWQAAGGRLVNVESSHNGGRGISAQSANTVLDCYNCRAYDNGFVNLENGFGVSNGALMRCWNADASYNKASGFRASVTAADGCYFDGKADGNGTAGVELYSQNGNLGRVFGRYNNGYGLVAYSVTGWNGSWVAFTDTGLGFTTPAGVVLAQNVSGTAVELYGCTSNHFDAILGTRPLGYALALSVDVANSSAPSLNNDFGYVLGDYANAVDVDPAITFVGASGNRISVADIRHTSVAVDFSSPGSAISSDNNWIGHLIADNISQSVARFTYGTGNKIEKVTARDCPCTNSATYKGVVSFVGANVIANEVDWLDYKDQGLGVTLPQYLAYADANATSNVVRDGPRRSWLTAPALDSNSSNRFWPRLRVRPQVAGTAALTVPGRNLAANTTTAQALTAGTWYYGPAEIDYQVVVANFYVEVTAAPATNAKLRIGLYRADENEQPIGNPVFDSGDVAVASGFTGVKAVSAGSIAVPPGRYLVVHTVDTVMTLRVTFAYDAANGISAGMGAASGVVGMTVAQGYPAGALPAAVPWTTLGVGAAGFRHYVFWQISQP